ncbi:MAG: protein-L-isoaspartate O-methyltransferase [Magnetococcus sp. WYHC-3]
MDYTTARSNMVNSQVAPNRIRDTALVAAFRQVPRECYVDPAQAVFAYSDAPISLDPSGHRLMLSPVQQAWLIEALGVGPGDKVLVVGAGTGYEAALLARMGVNVHALESNAELLQRGRGLTQDSGVEWRQGDLEEGWPQSSPFDGILFGAAATVIPSKLVGQLGSDGRLVAIVGQPGSPVMVAQKVVGVSGSDRPEHLFETVAPHLPDLLPGGGFQL